MLPRRSASATQNSVVSSENSWNSPPQKTPCYCPSRLTTTPASLEALAAHGWIDLQCGACVCIRWHACVGRPRERRLCLCHGEGASRMQAGQCVARDRVTRRASAGCVCDRARTHLHASGAVHCTKTIDRATVISDPRTPAAREFSNPGAKLVYFSGSAHSGTKKVGNV